jgi:hypothetical protein
VRALVLCDTIYLTRVVPLAQEYQAGLLSQPRATLASTTDTPTTSPTAYIPYQSRMGAYPYAIGTWGYHHYPSIPTATASSSVPPVVAQGDSATNLVASGTFAYPYAGVQYTPGQSAYVPPRIKYPYGAPALPAATPSSSSPSTEVTSTSSAVRERPYNDIQWKQPYIGLPDPIPATEPQAQKESTSSTDVPESTPNPGEAAPISDGGNAIPSAVNPVPTSAEITA